MARWTVLVTVQLLCLCQFSLQAANTSAASPNSSTISTGLPTWSNVSSSTSNGSSLENSQQQEITRLKHLSLCLFIVSVIFFLIAAFSLYSYCKEKSFFGKLNHKKKSKSPNTKRIDNYRKYISALGKSKASLVKSECTTSETTNKTNETDKTETPSDRTKSVNKKDNSANTEITTESSEMSETNNIPSSNDKILNVDKSLNGAKETDRTQKSSTSLHKIASHEKKSCPSKRQLPNDPSVERFFSIEETDN